MKKKSLIGLLLTVALLCVVMVCQTVGAFSSLFDVAPVPYERQQYYSDYQLKSVEVFKNGSKTLTYTYNNTYYNDGSVSTDRTITLNGSNESATSTWLKKYDEQGRLKTVSIKSNANPSLYRYLTYSFSEDSKDFRTLDYFNGDDSLAYATYNPEYNGILRGNLSYTYDKAGRISEMYGTINGNAVSEKYTYVVDDQNRIVERHYTQGDEITGVINVSYNDNGRIETERLEQTSDVWVYKTTFNKNNQITGSSKRQYEDGNDEPSYIVDVDYEYDEHGNLISQTYTMAFDKDSEPEVTRYVFTYEYHPLNFIPAEVPAIIDAKDNYSEAQTSLNDGDRINVEMTEPNSGSIKSAGTMEYSDGTQYYYNVIEKPLDASDDQVFSLNFTGEDTGSIDESDPAPAQSYYIYDDNTFSKDHLVASVENGKMKDVTGQSIGETTVEPANGGGNGKLMMALPLQIKSASETGTNISVTVPANTLEQNKTYYFVLSSDVVMSEDVSKSTNTDMVFKFTTGKVPEHEHTAGEPVRENEVPATCTKEGSYDEVVYCSECGEEISRTKKTIDKTAHTEEVVKGKDATCTEAGLTDGEKCSVCNEVLVAQKEIPALGHDFKDGVCTRCGAIDPDYKPDVNNDLDPSVNGIVQCPDGRWAMYKNGKVDTTCTTIAQNQYGWWRVENGYVNFDAQGIYQNKYGWWKTTDGKVTFKEFGLFENENGTWRVEFSKVNFLANGIYKGKDGWYKTTNGKVTFDETGIFQNQFGWWYCKNSKVDFDFTGVASNQYGKWYVKSGKVDFTKLGFVKYDGKTYTIMFGKVLFG